MTGIAVCARARSGHAAAAPPNTLMKSRRLIVAPDDYNKGIVSTCTGGLEGANVALGQ